MYLPARVARQFVSFWFCCPASELCEGALGLELRALKCSPLYPSAGRGAPDGAQKGPCESVRGRDAAHQRKYVSRSCSSHTPTFALCVFLSLAVSAFLMASPSLSPFFSEMALPFHIELKNLIMHSLDIQACYLCSVSV